MLTSRTLSSKPSFNWFAMLISFAFVLLGLWMIRDGHWLGWLEVGLFGFGLIVLIVPNLFKLHRLHLEPEGFQRFPGFGHPRLAWSEVNRFFLTSDGQTVVYELFPEPGESSEDSDEYFAHFPSTYGLTAGELLEVLQRYKDASSNSA